VYGKGVYFAKNACDAISGLNGNSCKFDDNGEAELLYCRVICGESDVGDKFKIRPTYKPHVSDKHEYETMVDNQTNPNIYVTCSKYQAFPCLKIVIKKLETQQNFF